MSDSEDAQTAEYPPTDQVAAATHHGPQLAYSEHVWDDNDYFWTYGWRPVLVRAGLVFAVLMAVAAVIVTVWRTTDGHPFASRSSSTAPLATSSSSAVPAAEPSATAPATTVTVTQTVPDIADETPSPRTTAVALPPAAPDSRTGDQTYISLASQIPGVIITDPTKFLAGGRLACQDIAANGRAATESDVLHNDPGFVSWQATALVNAAIVAYCPQYAGVS